MGRLALDIMSKLLNSHNVSSDDFMEQKYKLPEGGMSTIPKPPGHVIIEHMLNDSKLLKKVKACETVVRQYNKSKSIFQLNS